MTVFFLSHPPIAGGSVGSGGSDSSGIASVPVSPGCDDGSPEDANSPESQGGGDDGGLPESVSGIGEIVAEIVAKVPEVDPELPIETTLESLPPWFNLLTSEEELRSAKAGLKKMKEASERCASHIKRFDSKASRNRDDRAIVCEARAIVAAYESCLKSNSMQDALASCSPLISAAVRHANGGIAAVSDWVSEMAIQSTVLHHYRSVFPERIRS